MAGRMKIYIQKATQISIQPPLTEEWMETPILPSNRLEKFKCPDFKQFIAPAQSRRMCTVLKCAISAAKEAVREELRPNLDGILTGTGLGCLESSEKFLKSMIEDREQSLSPSNFIQSTHNTIGSQIAIAFQCHQYNITYSNRGTSFDSALFNALLKFRLGEFHNALVAGVDEMEEGYFHLLDHIGYWKKEMPSKNDFFAPSTEGTFAGENAVCFLLSDQKSDDTLCEIVGCDLLYHPSNQRLQETLGTMMARGNVESIDAVMVGNNGSISNDEEYNRLCDLLCPNATVLLYKHLFGESYTISSAGLYACSQILSKGKVPDNMVLKGEVKQPKNILLLNHFQRTEYSLTLVRL